MSEFRKLIVERIKKETTDRDKWYRLREKRATNDCETRISLLQDLLDDGDAANGAATSASGLNIADVTGSFNLNIIRQWFDAVEDLNPGYLQKSDYKLAKEIYEKLGLPIPKSISSNCR